MSTRFTPPMIGTALAAATVATAIATPAGAEVPRVAADIAPVHGLVARVMDGLGTPGLIVAPGASPHGYALRPSEARTLDQADAVFWMGPGLAHWLGDSIATLAPDAVVVDLLEAPGTLALEFREGAVFEGHDHADGAAHGHDDEEHENGAHEGGAHEDDEHEGGDHEGGDHEGGDHDEADHDAHAHDGTDPHAWLDPQNAALWLDLIAEELAALDPANARAYRDNAAAGQQEIAAAEAEARQVLAGAGPISFVVFHDAYHYFENRFGLSAAGSISLSDASDPSPARIEEVRHTVLDLGVACVFAEPQFSQSVVETVTEGTGARAAVVDPLGFEIPMGPGFYPALIGSLAEDIAACGS